MAMERDPEWWEHLVKHSQPRIGTEMQQRCENHAREMQEEGAVTCGKGEMIRQRTIKGLLQHCR